MQRRALAAWTLVAGLFGWGMAEAQQRLMGRDGRPIEMVYLGCPAPDARLDPCGSTDRPLNVRAQMVGLDGQPLQVSGTVAVSGVAGAVQVAGSVSVAGLPDIRLAAGQRVAVDSLPAVALAAGQHVGITGSLPPVSLATGQSVGVSSLPPVAIASLPSVQLAAGQAVGITGTASVSGTVGISGTVPVTASGAWSMAPFTGTPTASPVIAAGTTATQVFAARAARRYLTLQNQSTTDLIWCNLAGAAAVAGPPSLRIAPGGALNHGLAPGFVSGAAVSCIASSANTPLAAWEG